MWSQTLMAAIIKYEVSLLIYIYIYMLTEPVHLLLGSFTVHIMPIVKGLEILRNCLIKLIFLVSLLKFYI